MKIKRSLFKLKRKIICFLSGGQKILVLGDSHAGIFEYGFDNNLLPAYYLNCDIVGGATAYGLANRHSTSRARIRFEHSLAHHPSFDTVFIMLGEIDCSVTFWLLAEKYQRPAAEFIPQALANLAQFVDWIRAQPRPKQVVLVAVPLPSVKDEQAATQELVLRRGLTSTQLQRTQMVMQYNKALHALAREKNLPCLDVTDDLLDPATGFIADRFCRDDIVDHHHSFERTAHFWFDRMYQLLA